MPIRIEGLQQVIEAFDDIDNFNQWAVKPMNKSVQLIHDDIATYPPQRAEVTYRRTGTLGRTWTTKVTKSRNGIKGEVGNKTAYAPFVQEAEEQTWPHALTGWVTDEDVLTKNENIIIDYWGSEIDRLLKR